jgi:hypothetical protein
VLLLTGWLFWLYDDLMTVPPCEHCGQPWAHGFGDPPVRRGVGKVIVLAVLGGIAAYLLLIVAAAYLFAGLTRPTGTVIFRHVVAGPLRPRLQACELFYKWEGTHDPNVLNRAVADAHSPRVPLQSQLRLRTDLGGLRSSTRNATYAHSPTTISFEHAVQADCAPIVAAYHHV